MSNAVRTAPFRVVFKALGKFRAPKTPIIPTDYFLGSGKPIQTPNGYFRACVPAINKWFEPFNGSTSIKQLNKTYLEPLIGLLYHPPPNCVLANFEEIVQTPQGKLIFTRHEDMPFEYILYQQENFIPKGNSPNSVYLTQTPISRLPQALQNDLGITTFEKLLPRFDPKNSSIWIGFNETRTPLHRDPNNNVFIQLVGKKRVRMFTPESGQRIFDEVQRQIGGSKSGRIRDEDMFVGEEGKILDELVWGPGWGQGMTAVSKSAPLSSSMLSNVTSSSSKLSTSAPLMTPQSISQSPDDMSNRGNGEILVGWESELEEGDAIVIPLGYWHTIRGVSDGVNGSVRIILFPKVMHANFLEG
jgi:hypothetical protein